MPDLGKEEVARSRPFRPDAACLPAQRYAQGGGGKDEGEQVPRPPEVRYAPSGAMQLECASRMQPRHRP
jgi:hypothetical protein